jgi:hypothetical protein
MAKPDLPDHRDLKGNKENPVPLAPLALWVQPVPKENKVQLVPKARLVLVVVRVEAHLMAGNQEF